MQHLFHSIRKLLAAIIIAGVPLAAGAQISSFEYFFDTDPGFGNGIPVTGGFTPGNTVSLGMNVPVGNLSGGFHQLCYRARLANGQWSHTQTRTFYTTNFSAGNGDVAAAEYFFDADPGIGQGTNLGIAGGPSVSQTVAIPVTGLQPGFHQLHIRAKNNNNIWGHYQSRNFYITNFSGGSGNITGAEYFFDTDPGTGQGTAIALNSGASVTQTLAIPVTGLGSGFHRLYLRTKNNNNIWSHYQTRSFFVSTLSTANAKIAAAEYFIDTDPGAGNGQPIVINPPQDSVSQNFILSIPAGVPEGDHKLVMRVRNEAGQWSHYQTQPFYINLPKPGSGNALQFNGYDDYAAITYNGPQVANTFTYELWVQPSGTISLYSASGGGIPGTGGQQYVLAPNHGGNANAGMGLSVGTNGVQVVEHANYYMPVVLSWNHPISGWTHLAVVYDNKQPSLYVNGVLVQTGVTSVRDSVLPFVNHYTEFGRGSYGSYTGKLDEVRLWKTALSQSEIRDWMCRKLAAAHPQYGSLVSCFNLDEPTGNSLYGDLNGATGTLMNGPARIVSGAAIGNLSAHNYSGATAGASLANPVRGDAVTATLTNGGADGIQIYCVTDTANTTNGTTCLGTNNGYFGVFTANGTTPSYDAVYNYSGIGTPGFNEAGVKLYRRTDNSGTTWADAAAGLDTAANTLALSDTLRAEYLVSSAVVAPGITITASPNDTICAGTAVTFTASITNGGTIPAYQWKKNGLNVGGGNVTYTDSTLLNGDVVTCVLTSNSTCVSPASATSNAIGITVTNSLAAGVTASAMPGTTICAGAQVVFASQPSNGGSAPVYQWRVNGTAVGGNAPTFTSSTLQQNDVVTVDMSTNAACAGPATVTSAGLSMTVNPVPVPTISIAAPVTALCSGASVTFTASATHEGTSPVYQWRKNGSNVGTNSATYTDNALSDGAVITCILTSNATCASPATVTSNSLTLSVHSSAAPAVTISAAPGNTVCTGTAVTFSATVTNGGSAPAYQWKKNGNNIGTNAATYTDTALLHLDVITCEVVSSESCATPSGAVSNSITMTVDPYQTPTITIAAGPNDTICAGTSVTFTASTTNGGSAPAYQWKKNGLNTGSNSAVYTDNALNDGDIITAVLTSNAGCTTTPAANANSINMTVHPLPLVDAGADQTILQGSSIALTATGAASYHWSNGDTTATTVVSPTATTTYTVSTANSYGCTASDAVVVTVNFSALSVSPATYNYGNVVVGMPAAYTVTVTNNGTLTETVSGAAIAAPFSTSFTSQTVAPGASVAIPVSFTPAGTLIYQQALAITTSAGNYSVVLQGRGVSAAPAWTVTPAAYTFNQTIAGDSTVHLFTVANTGNVPVTISGVTSTNPAFAGTVPAGTIPVGGQLLLQVKFRPAAVAAYTGTVSLSAANPGLGPVAVSLSGDGYLPGNAPVLQYVSAAPYNGMGGVDIPVGPAGNFTYRVVYKSPDGRAPMSGYPQVGIDRNADGDFLDAGEGVYAMNKVGSGNDWINGEVFTYTSGLSIGNTYGYRFFAKDSLGNAAGSLPTVYKAGPNVTNQALDLAIYANDITFSNNNPGVGQQFTVSAVVHNNSPYSASNVPVRFYKDSVFLTSATLPFIGANSTATITRNFSFSPDGFYPIKIWIDSAATLGENNVLNNYAIRPVIVGNFSLPGTITITSTASTQSCPAPGVLISGYAAYSGLNLQGTPPVLGGTVTVQIAGGPALTTNTVTGGYWSVYYSGFPCSVAQSYTVAVTDYTLTGSTGAAAFTAPCQNCYTGGSGYTIGGSGSPGSGCIRDGQPFSYQVSLTNPCNADTMRNDTTYVYADGVLTYTHPVAVMAPCQQVSYSDAFSLTAGTHVLSFTHVSYDSTGRHVYSQSSAVNVEQDLPDLYPGAFSQTGATALSFRDINPTCVAAGAHKVYLYDSLSGNARILLDSFAVSAMAGPGSQPLLYSRPGWQMGYHYLQFVTDVHQQVAERDETNNVLHALLYVPFPELTIDDVALSASNIQAGSVVNFSARVHNTGSTAGAYKVQFLAGGLPVGSKVQLTGLAGNTTALVLSDPYTVPADSCPLLITAIVDADNDVAELLESNNTATLTVGADITGGIGCPGTGSSCNPYVIVKNALTHFVTSVSNTGNRDAGNVSVSFRTGGTTIGSDVIPAVPAGSSAAAGIYHSFAAAGNYVIAVSTDTANLLCELNEGNNDGAIFVRVVEGLPDLELLSQHISPSNLNPNPNQSVSVVASVFNKGTQTSGPTTVRFYVDNVQLGADVSIDSLYTGRDTTVMATALYASPTVGPKIIRVVADNPNLVAELREDNNEATRAIIVGGAPDLAHSIHEAITCSRTGFRKGELVEIRNYIRNYGGDSGRAYLRYYVTNPQGIKTLLDSVQFTLQSNDSMRVASTWLVNMEGRGVITTEIVHCSPQEFNEFNNVDSLVFTAGPELRIPSLQAADTVLCDGEPLSIGFSVHKSSQPVSYEWFKNGVSTGNTSALLLYLPAVALSDSGSYEVVATDSFGTIHSPLQHIRVKPVLTPTVATAAYPGQVICDGTSVKFSAQTAAAGTAVSYQWMKNNMAVGTDAFEYIDTGLVSGDVIQCTIVSGTRCVSSAPVTSAGVTMTVNPLSGGLAGANASQTYDVDSGMYLNYTDNGCQLIATVAATMGNDLGPTTATTSINNALTGFVHRYTEITPTYNLPALVRLYFLPSEFAAYNTAAAANGQPLLPVAANDPNVANIVVYQYHGLPSGGTTGPGGQYDAGNVTVIRNSSISKVYNAASGYWEISFPVSGFSGHFLKAENPVPLAIRLGDIRAVNKGTANEVSWNTEQEDAGDYFELERSTDGSHFMQIARVEGKGGASTYRFRDGQAVTGINYYRLRMVERGGRSGVSKTVTAVVARGAFALEAYPNPVKDVLTVLTRGAAADGRIQITDAGGSQLRSVAVAGDKAVFDIRTLPAGIYFVRYTDSVHTATVRIVKE